MALSEWGERELLKKIMAKFGAADERVVVPIGDDAAVFDCNGQKVAVTSDLMAEGVHFDYAYTNCFQAAYKLIVSNVSDIYAMGGTPAFGFLALSMSDKRTTEEFDEFLGGIADASERYGVRILGGDLSSASQGDCYTATVVGFVRNPVTRSGARTGDSIFVTGVLGDAAAGLAYLRKTGMKPVLAGGRAAGDDGIEDEILSPIMRHLLPEARDPAEFADRVTAMIDISDGLLIDLSRLCVQSGKGAILFKEKIPVSEGAKKIAAQCGISAMDFALTGGEDYELLFSSPASDIEGCIRIGEIIDAGYYFVSPGGKREPFLPKGYEHFVDKGKD